MIVAADPEIDPPLAVPLRLTADTRLAFRQQAIEHVSKLLRGDATVLELDMRMTADIDASGLGILVLLQKRAREAGMSTRIRSARPSIRESIEGARLHHLFDFVE
jgi:anti-anti-sigma regulatory factor